MTVLSGKAIKAIVKELESLQQTPPEDIQVIGNEEDLTQIEAWIRGPDGTPYQDGYFKVRLTLDGNFPDTPPKGNFITKIFHPNVSPIGEICVNTLKKDWKPELGIKHVLLTIKCLLIVPNPESALNEEAGKLLLEQYDDYAKRAKLYTSIQAKSGKNEFLQLEKERSIDKTKENATVKRGSFIPSVLKPLSNATDLNTQKRQGEEEEKEEKEVKKIKKSIVKKKALRRL